MKHLRQLIGQKLSSWKKPAAPAPRVTPIDEQQLRAIAGGGPAGTWRQLPDA